MQNTQDPQKVLLDLPPGVICDLASAVGDHKLIVNILEQHCTKFGQRGKLVNLGLVTFPMWCADASLTLTHQGHEVAKACRAFVQSVDPRDIPAILARRRNLVSNDSAPVLH